MREMVSKYKSPLIAIGLVLILALSGFIGQFIVLPMRESKNQTESNITDQLIGIDSNVISIEWINQEKTDENPWGVTANIIEMEEGNRAIFLMPGTAVKIKYHVGEEDVLPIQYSIHPWIAEISDRLKLSISIDKENIGCLTISKKDILKTAAYQLDISHYHETDIDIEIENVIVDGNDLSGDWLVLWVE